MINQIKDILLGDVVKKNVEELIVNVPDFPIEGIQFKDITPLFQNSKVMNELIQYFGEIYRTRAATGEINKIVCIDSRGFIFGSLLAHYTGLPFVLARKAGKLPRETVSYEYDLEYGSNKLEIQSCDIQKEDRVVIVDDLLATGGTIAAVCRLVESLGGEVSSIWNLIELEALQGRKKIESQCNNSKLKFEYLIKY